MDVVVADVCWWCLSSYRKWGHVFCSEVFFVWMCGWHMFGVNATKIKVIIVERESESDCSGRIDKKDLEVVNKFVYFRVMMCKYCACCKNKWGEVNEESIIKQIAEQYS